MEIPKAYEYYRQLIAVGESKYKAIDHAAQVFGVPKKKLTQYINHCESVSKPVEKIAYMRKKMATAKSFESPVLTVPIADLEIVMAALEEKDQELDILIDTLDSMSVWRLRTEIAERELKLEQEQSAYYERQMWYFHDLAESETKRAEAALEEKDQELDILIDTLEGTWQAATLAMHDCWREEKTKLEQRLQQPIKLPKGFYHDYGVVHALLGVGDVMISHIKWPDAQGIAFSPMPEGKAGIGVNIDAEVAGVTSDNLGAVFIVKATSVLALEILRDSVQMAIDGFKVEGE